MRKHPGVAAVLLLTSVLAAAPQASESPVDRLIAALLGSNAMTADLQELTDVIGGRATGSPSNERAIEWAMAVFRAAGVEARREPFEMPARWLERSATATVTGAASFAPRVAAMPFSAATASTGLRAPLVDGGTGSDADLARLGATIRGAWVLVQTPVLATLDDLFAEYTAASATEARLLPAGPAGLVYMSSRSHDLLYRHNASRGLDNVHPMLIMEREEAARALRMLRGGSTLSLTAAIELEPGGPYQSANVIGEIRGRDRPNEIVLIGAHLDSWDLGTGANDNGCNVAMLLDMARQMRRLGIQPRRTIRFALFNGEEQGMFGSWAYTRAHRDELDRHVMASSYDVGSGRINGFFTNGRPALLSLVEGALGAVGELGPFTQLDAPIVGTDNFDFMLEGVPNVVANQESANYGPSYHSRADTFDKVDLRQLRLNAAVAASVTWAFAEMDAALPRQSRAEVEALFKNSDLEAQMRGMGVWKDWAEGHRGRAK
jgi:carboxypeptidase Q